MLAYAQKLDTEIIPSVDERARALALMESIEDNYTFHVRDFCRWIREGDRQIDYNALRDYFIELNNSDYAAGTKRVKRQAVKKRVRQLQDAIGFNVETALKLDRALSQLDREPGAKAPKVNSQEVGGDKVLSRLDFDTLIDGARSLKQALFMEFLWSTGCRISEMVNIKARNCEDLGRLVNIRITGKGNKERHIKIPADLYSRIREAFRSGEYLFSTSTGHPYSRSYVSNQIKKLGRHVLGRNISAHTFRHSFATRKISETNKIKAVSRYLGHSSTSITLNMYVHETLTDDELFL